MSGQELAVYRREKDAKLPTITSRGSAGYTIYANHSGYIDANSRIVVSTGLAISIPHGYCGQLWSIPKLQFNSDITVGPEVIDSDYTDELKIILYNRSKTRFTFKQHRGIAQLIITPIITPPVVNYTWMS